MWQALVNMIMNPWVLQKAGNLTSQVTISFSARTLLHGGSQFLVTKLLNQLISPLKSIRIKAKLSLCLTKHIMKMYPVLN